MLQEQISTVEGVKLNMFKREIINPWLDLDLPKPAVKDAESSSCPQVGFTYLEMFLLSVVIFLAIYKLYILRDRIKDVIIVCFVTCSLALSMYRSSPAQTVSAASDLNSVELRSRNRSNDVSKGLEKQIRPTSSKCCSNVDKGSSNGEDYVIIDIEESQE